MVFEMLDVVDRNPEEVGSRKLPTAILLLTDSGGTEAITWGDIALSFDQRSTSTGHRHVVRPL